MATEDHSNDVLFPPRLGVSARAVAVWRFTSHRKAVFQPASCEAPRTVRKNELLSRKTHASNGPNRHNFGAANCSRLDSRMWAEQNYRREKIEKIGKQKNRVQRV
jgi:hypothetical protein